MNRNVIIPSLLIAVILSISAGIAKAFDDIDAHRNCCYCEMDRKAYGYSRMLIIYENGTEVGVCSLHCALVALDAEKGGKIKAMLVADRVSRKLIDVEKAVWVIGGKKSGVMTKRPKWAFESREAAEKFIGSYGGRIASWEEILAAAQEDLAREVL